jgi:hypothetical protein
MESSFSKEKELPQYTDSGRQAVLVNASKRILKNQMKASMKKWFGPHERVSMKNRQLIDSNPINPRGKAT